jgi:hypothetical protein
LRFISLNLNEIKREIIRVDKKFSKAEDSIMLFRSLFLATTSINNWYHSLSMGKK